MKKKIVLVGDFIPGSGLTKYIEDVFGGFNLDKYSISAVKYGGSNELDKKITNYGWSLLSVSPVNQGIFKNIVSW